MLPAVPCPDENALIQFTAGAVPDAERSRTADHLDDCVSCRRVVSALALATGARAERPVAALAPGEVLGRYQVARLLGAGGMGAVYAARDTQLERQVALKVIHPARLEGLPEAEARGRVLREAQAMARLSHPNVVAVFDIGEQAERVWMAMELSDGVTLDRWLAAGGHSPREVLRVFAEAGAGLAAAHRAGIVHRDFKPQNVLVDQAGRVRVTDFGLAREGWEGTGVVAAGELAGLSELTRTGVLVGTPSYMAPEQFLGRADVRSDQFAFCVALYEALAGRRPFGGETLVALRQAIERGQLGDRPRGVPRRVWPVLVRGLSSDPAARFESLEAVLASLRGGPSRRWLLAGAAACAVLVLVLVLVVVGWRALAPGERVSRAPVMSGSVPMIRLRPGAEFSWQLPGVTRVAVGDPSIADVKVKGDTLLILAGTPGKTTVLAWTGEGRRTSRLVHVVEDAQADPAQAQQQPAIRLQSGERRLLAIPGLVRLAVGDLEVVQVATTGDSEVEVVGGTPGRTQMLAWTGEDGRRDFTFEVVAAPPTP
jgi:hypothetical protein